MSDIFISYAREDRDWVQSLAAALVEQRWSVWWDREMVAGDDINHVIQDELATSCCVIVVWSKASVRSAWVRDEASRGLEREVLLPVRLADVEPPLPFGQVHTVNLVGWRGEGDAPEFQSLMRAIERHCPREGLPPPALPPARSRRWLRPALAAAGAVTVALVGYAAVLRKTGPAVDHPGKALRSAPAQVSSSAFADMLIRHDFFDSRRNPAGKGVVHEFQPVVVGDVIMIRDVATGLMWQKRGGGGADHQTHDDAENLIARMNATQFGGFSDWRLPTIEEAMSLMEPREIDHGGKKCHLDLVFGTERLSVWTSDLNTSDRGWTVYYCFDAFADIESIIFNASVRAVRSDKPAAGTGTFARAMPAVPKKRVRCDTPMLDETVEEIGYLEARDDMAEQFYRLVVCRHTKDGGRWLLLKGMHSSNTVEEAAHAVELAKRKVDCGDIENDLTRTMPLTLTLCQRGGEPVSLELELTARNADKSAKEPQRLSVPLTAVTAAPSNGDAGA